MQVNVGEYVVNAQNDVCISDSLDRWYDFGIIPVVLNFPS